MCYIMYIVFFFFSSRRRHTRFSRDWSSDVCSSDLHKGPEVEQALAQHRIEGHRLPSYSPQMNAAEPWIGWATEVLSANTCWQDHGALVPSFVAFVASMAKRPHAVLRRCVPDMLGFNCI